MKSPTARSPDAGTPERVAENRLPRTREKSPRQRRFSDRILSPIILSPAMILIVIFVYVFIAITVWVSLSNWHTMKIDMSIRSPLGATYQQMFMMPRWHANLRNVFIFTALFLTFSLAFGLLLALLLDRKLIGYTIFRNVFLFPYALSFIVTGIAWRWIFNPETGINILIDTLGLNKLIQACGGPPLHPGWTTDPTVLFSLNNWLGMLFPPVKTMSIQLGIPMALIPVVVAAAWQLTGFAMSMYIAGLATVPHELREAARIDGATEFQVYTKVVIPQLNPVTVSTAIILGHVSLKIFDLIFAMTGVGPGFATDVPGIFVFEQTFKATRYNLGAAASVIMLLLVSVIIVPYLWTNMRKR
ncbi:MAG TPA: sugar ABC transporter permease, partial [Chthoniobacterales bacterium]|nr:sugar ABC transporter permease [Chthoniobacterales bacterium]